MPLRRRAPGAAAALRRLLVTLVDLATGVVCVLIVLGILFVVLKANRHNSIVRDVHDAAKTLVGPFDGMFNLRKRRAEIAVNWGIAAVVYLVAGRAVSVLLARLSGRAATR